MKRRGSIERAQAVLPAGYVAEHGHRQGYDPLGPGRADASATPSGLATPERGAQISMFRFGSGLAAVSGDFWRPAGGQDRAAAARPARYWPPRPPRRGEPALGPTDPDTLLSASLEGLTHRFGQAPPQAVVVFSDGRARDRDRGRHDRPGL